MSKLLPFNLFVRQALLYPLFSPFLPPVNKVEKNYSYAAGSLIGTLEGGGGYGLPKTGQTISYRAGDDGDLKKGYPLTGDRFTDNGDGTITDNATGLMWVKDGEGAGCNGGNVINWNGAIDFCNSLNFAGHADWRLPNINELQSIVNYGTVSPSSYPTYFPGTKSDFYWSSTTYADGSAYVWFVYFDYGYVDYLSKTDVNYVRPVRG